MNRIVIYTSITNCFDQIPQLVSTWSGCDYVCFTDNPHLRSDVWNLRLLPSSNLDPRRRARLPKILPHLFLPESDLSIWMDGNVVPEVDLFQFAKANLKDRAALFFAHGERQCLYEEADKCITLGKDSADLINSQIAKYQREGMPRNFGLAECSILIRRHNDPQLIALMNSWWNELIAWSARDQLSLPYVSWKLKYDFPLVQNQDADGARSVYRRAHHYHAVRTSKKHKNLRACEMIVLSYPKSGRTWLRQALAAYRAEKHGEIDSGEFGPGSIGGRGIAFDHEYMEMFQDCAETPRLLHRKLLNRKRLVVLTRDPRSVVVSYFNHQRYREHLAIGSLLEFIESPIYGIERQSAFVNLLIDLVGANSRNSILLRYEDLITDPRSHFERFIQFVERSPVDASKLEATIARTTFAAMQQAEIDLSIAGVAQRTVARLGARNWDGNFNALKVRKADPNEARELLPAAVWDRLSALPETSRLLGRLGYE
jgi:hypothetical protein